MYIYEFNTDHEFYNKNIYIFSLRNNIYLVFDKNHDKNEIQKLIDGLFIYPNNYISLMINNVEKFIMYKINLLDLYNVNTLHPKYYIYNELNRNNFINIVNYFVLYHSIFIDYKLICDINIFVHLPNVKHIQIFSK